MRNSCLFINTVYKLRGTIRHLRSELNIGRFVIYVDVFIDRVSMYFEFFQFIFISFCNTVYFYIKNAKVQYYVIMSHRELNIKLNIAVQIT